MINDLEIDGFSIAVCDEIGVELSRHRSRSFDEMERWGDDLSSFDLIVALSPASQRRALELTRLFHLTVEYWPILDPTGIGETREMKLASQANPRSNFINLGKNGVNLSCLNCFANPFETHLVQAKET